MSIKNIVNGHVNEILNKHEDVGTARMNICKQCPLFLLDPIWGPRCNPELYLNTDTNQTSEYAQAGFKSGCGCRLKAKTRDLDSHCPLAKW